MVPSKLQELTPIARSLADRINSHEAHVAVIGCGYVGLPLALSFVTRGFAVLAIDRDAERVALLKRGKSYMVDISDAELDTALRTGRFSPTSSFDELTGVDIVFVCVPTPFDRAKAPDLSYVLSATGDIAKRLHQGQLVILESTTFPGTTDELVRPLLESAGLRAGTDFFLAYSPERVDPGNATFGIANTSKVVGGTDDASTALAVSALEQVVTDASVHALSSTRVAELTKLLENVFRSVNIALVNELAMLCDRMNIDIWEVVGAASTKPYGFMPFYPGPGVGGHCIPVDPYYLSWRAREFDFSTKFIDLAAETNLEMPFFTVDRVRRMLSRADRALHGAHLLVLGASFKKDVDDARNSAALRVMEILINEGAKIEYHDPFVAQVKLARRIFSGEPSYVQLGSVALTPKRVKEADAVVILVNHTRVDYTLVLEHAALVFDAVNATSGLDRTGVVERL